MFKNITFILHKPQLSENIGACARAMKNFNISKLSIVDPKPMFPNDKIIARSHNLTEALIDVTAHAEMQAITSASNHIGGKYLNDCTMYVTLEPCQMCAGIQSKFIPSSKSISV